MSEHTYIIWGNFFNFLRFTGLAPYEKTKTGTYIVCKKFQIYSLFISLLNFSYFLLDYQIIMRYMEGENILSIIFILLDMLGYNFAFILCVLTIIYKSSELSFLINRIIKINKSFQKLASLEFKNSYVFGINLYFFTQNILFLSLSITDNIRENIWDINHFLKAFFSLLAGQIFIFTDINILFFMNNSFIIFRGINLLILKKDLKYSKIFLRFHNKACDIVDLINKCFSEVLFVFVAVEFSSLVFVVHFKNKHGSDEYDSMSLSIHWFLLYFAKLFIKVAYGRSVKIEVGINFNKKNFL